MCGFLSHTCIWGPGPQPRHVPWLGIKAASLWFTGQHSIHWATPARAFGVFLMWCVVTFPEPFPFKSIDNFVIKPCLLSEFQGSTAGETFLRTGSFQECLTSDIEGAAISAAKNVYTGVAKSSFIVVCMEKDMQVIIITIALLTQNNVTMAH